MPEPKGRSGVGSRPDSRIDTSRNPWLVVSAIEWTASASIALEPESRPPASLPTAMIALAASAIRTVRREPSSWRLRTTERRLVTVGDAAAEPLRPSVRLGAHRRPRT